MKTLGEVFYDGYCEALSNTRMPRWDELPESLRIAYEAGAEAVCDELRWRGANSTRRLSPGKGGETQTK